MNRRDFVSYSVAALAADSALAGGSALAGTEPGLRIGLNLFSIPKTLEKDFRAGMAFIAGLGYSEVETYGPYPFSTPEEIAEWQKIIPQVGFSGTGYFGLTQDQVVASLKENKLTAPSMHTGILTLQQRMGPLAAAAHALGATYVTLPAMPASMRQSLDDYKRAADTFNAIGEDARRHGLRFAYHNHGYGWHEQEGEIPLKVVLQRTDPKLVFLEMDIYWTTAGGADPVQLLKDYPTRYKMLHLKDMKEKRHFSGDGGGPSQWLELFPYMTTVGGGALDIKGIVAQARRNGVDHYIVEQDKVADPQVALQRSADFLLKL
jgi:sugar phosphate isomerase/epimerase